MSGLNERSKRQIALLAGDDLEGAAHDEARRSVESCPDCRRHWVRVCGCLDVLERVGKSAEAVPDESLWPVVERRLQPVTPLRPQKFNGWVPALSMAAACIALLIAGQMDSVPQDEVVLEGPGLREAVGPVPPPNVPESGSRTQDNRPDRGQFGKHGAGPLSGGYYLPVVPRTGFWTGP